MGNRYQMKDQGDTKNLKIKKLKKKFQFRGPRHKYNYIFSDYSAVVQVFFYPIIFHDAVLPIILESRLIFQMDHAVCKGILGVFINTLTTSLHTSVCL